MDYRGGWERPCRCWRLLVRVLGKPCKQGWGVLCQRLFFQQGSYLVAVSVALLLTKSSPIYFGVRNHLRRTWSTSVVVVLVIWINDVGHPQTLAKVETWVVCLWVLSSVLPLNGLRLNHFVLCGHYIWWSCITTWALLFLLWWVGLGNSIISLHAWRQQNSWHSVVRLFLFLVINCDLLNKSVGIRSHWLAIVNRGCAQRPNHRIAPGSSVSCS